MRASLVVPTLNEAASIGHVLTAFRTAAAKGNAELFASDPLVWELLVVDGASTDGTAGIAQANGARVITEPRRGYGRAYKTGFSEATGDVLATLDGDATYPADEVPRLVRKLFDEGLDFITCDRLTHLDPAAMTREHRIGNYALNLFTRIAYHRFLKEGAGGRLYDTQSGMWVFRRSVLDRVQLTQDGMAMSEEFKLEVLLRGLRFSEVPVHYTERWGAPKLSSWRDGSQNLFFLFTKRFQVARELKERGVVPLADRRPSGPP